jgi:hypothetical protein
LNRFESNLKSVWRKIRKQKWKKRKVEIKIEKGPGEPNRPSSRSQPQPSNTPPPKRYPASLSPRWQVGPSCQHHHLHWFLSLSLETELAGVNAPTNSSRVMAINPLRL